LKNTSKILCLALAVLLCLGIFAGCNKKESAETFTVGFDANFPPYGYVANGEYVGFDIDLAKEVAKRNNWEIKLQPIEWTAKDSELESGAIDCIWNGFTMTDERLSQYAWTDAYVDNSQVFVVAKDSGIETLADLAGKTVAVQSASSAFDALNSEDSADLLASFKELVEVPDYNTAFMNLESGSVDAIAMDIGVAKYQISTHGDEYVILEEALVSELYGVGCLITNTELRDKIQATLEEMNEDGKLLAIATEWDLQDSLVFGQEGTSFEEICEARGITIG